MNTIRRIPIILLLAFFSMGARAQNPANQTVPVYRITVVGRTVKAINYRPLSGSTRISFRGTSIMSGATGKAQVSNRRSATGLHLQFEHMDPPTNFGPEYLTYVLWAITPDGRPSNIAEIVPHDGKVEAEVTVNLQAFGLIVTAEPYFAVHVPSDVVVMENEVTKDTVGKVEEIDAKYQLLERGQYTQNVSPRKPSRKRRKNSNGNRKLISEHSRPSCSGSKNAPNCYSN